LDIGNKQNAIHEQKYTDLKEENIVLNGALKELLKSNRKNIKQKNIDDCSKEKVVSSAEYNNLIHRYYYYYYVIDPNFIDNKF